MKVSDANRNGTYNPEHVKAIIMTPKFKALVSAGIAAFTGFASYIAAMPNSTQDAVTGTLVNLFPVACRGTVGGVFKAISMVCIYTAVHYAAKSGPQTTPPVTPAAPPASL